MHWTGKPENLAGGLFGPLTLSPSHMCMFSFVFAASFLTGMSSLKTTGSRDGSFSLLVLREAQSLALTGLNLIARNEGLCDRDPAEGGSRAFPLCQLPGAVHLLPLVQFFVGLHCQALQDLAVAKRSGAPGDSPTRSSRVSSRVEAHPEDSLCNLEAFSVASLSVLEHLVCHSGAVTCLLLSGVGVEADSAAREGNQSLDCHGHVNPAPRGLADDQGPHPLLKMLLHLLAFSSATSHLQASVLSQCLKVLVKLAENTSFDFLPRYNAAWESGFFVGLTYLLRSILWPLYFAHILTYLYCSVLSLGLGSKALSRES